MSIYSLENPKDIAKTKLKRSALKQVHIYGIFFAQVIAWGILMAVVLWLIISSSEPEVRVTSFVIDSILGPKPADNSLIHFDLTVRNPDLYKSIHYDILVLRITNSCYYYQSNRGATINYHKEGKTITQRPGETTSLGLHTIDYLAPFVNWDTDLYYLKGGNYFVRLRFVMDVKFMAFNKVVGSRQLMRTAKIYFNNTGYAFINPDGGLLLRPCTS